MNPRFTIALLLVALGCSGLKAQTQPLNAVNSMFYEPQCKSFSDMLGADVLRNGNPDDRSELVRELNGLSSGLSQVLELLQIRIIDFSSTKDAFGALDQIRLAPAIQGLTKQNYSNDSHYGIVVISRYRSGKPYLAVNILVFEKRNWKIVFMGDN